MQQRMIFPRRFLPNKGICGTRTVANAMPSTILITSANQDEVLFMQVKNLLSI